MPRRGLTLAAGFAVVALAVLASATTASAGHRPLVTSIDPAFLSTSDDGIVLARVRAAGATMVRLGVSWASVAPANEPVDWTPADPADPAYRWVDLDRLVKLSIAQGLTPYLTLSGAPRWAQSGRGPNVPDSSAARPDPDQFALFATAVARRYGGHYQGLPRVRYFEIWNEENISTFFWPQLENGRPVAPDLYRTLLNSAYAAIHRVRADNVVIAGGLAPFRDSTQSVVDQDQDWGPMKFMRSLLCLSPGNTKTCSAKVSFDIWAMHPYTSGGPTHTATRFHDVSLGNLPTMKQALDAARRHRTIRSRNGVGFWVTEFSWDSSPPDPQAIPVATLNQWVPHALYQMWKNGVSNVTWYTLRDQQPPGYVQGGLYFAGPTLARDRPKPYLRAFRFPVVALKQWNGRYVVWGRTPWGRRTSVVVEHLVGGRKTRIARLTTDRNGIFQFDAGLDGRGSVVARAPAMHTRSLPYALEPIPDRFYNPFGTNPLEPNPANP